MKILIYGINFSPELTGTGKYTGEFVDNLKEMGLDIHVVTAPPYYPEWKIHAGFRRFFYQKEYSKDISVIRCPLYVPKSLSLYKRLLHLTSFAFSSFPIILGKFFWKPNIIICVAPTLFFVPSAVLLSRLIKSKLIIHVQDYEVDAMLGLKMSTLSIAQKLAEKFERWCLTSADYISTISQTMIQKAKDKGIEEDKILFFPNWSEVERFNNITDVSITNLKLKLDLPTEKKIVLYSGNVGEKQGLEILIPVAEHFRGQDILFLVVGEGGGKEKLQKLVITNKLENIIFKPLQTYEDLPVLLSIPSCHLVIQRKGAADAVLPSKLTNILAVGGNAIITAERETELGKLCREYPGIALLVDPESPEALIEGINQSLTLPAVNMVAKDYANTYLRKDKIINDFINIIS